jgi:hypothetical protein
MKRSIVLFACLLIVGCSKSDSPPSGPAPLDSIHEACGVERWDVKNLLDNDVANVNFVPHISSILAVDSLAKISLGDSAPRMSFERQTLSIPCTIVAFKQEDDSDLHLVITDANSDSMIAEIPNVSCAEVAKSTHFAEFISARAWVVQHLGTPKKSFVKTNMPATVTGVLFQDFPHGQRGHALNYMELHPVLKIE